MAVNINFRLLKLATVGKYLLISGSAHDGNSNIYYLEWIYKEIHFIYKEKKSTQMRIWLFD